MKSYLYFDLITIYITVSESVSANCQHNTHFPLIYVSEL